VIFPYEGRFIQVTGKGRGNEKKGEEERDNSLRRREGQKTRRGMGAGTREKV
jgi:hypothetical protein